MMIGDIEARTVRYSILGKCDTEVKTHIPADLADEWRAKARRLDVSPSDLLRDLIILNLRGADFMRSLYESRLSVLGQNGANKEPAESGAGE